MTARGLLPAAAGAEGLDPDIRFMPVMGDSPDPAARPGDAWIVVPIDHYDGEGCYVVDEAGKAAVVLVDLWTARPGTSVRVSHGPHYGVDEWSRADFHSVVLAKCVGIIRVLDASHLSRRSGPTGGGANPTARKG